MEAKELRIGNYYNWRGGDAPDEGYDEKFNGNFDEMKKYPSRFRAIPLTEQWLKQLGAIKMNANYLGYKYSRFKLIWKRSYDYWYVVDWQDETYLTKIEFVHEFQNLIYAMDGKELVKQ